MKCILGIGNPGSRYQLTRHNIGFYLLDEFALNFKIDFKPSKSDYYFAEGEYEQKPFVLIKPTTFVNKTGIAVRQCLTSYNLNIQELLVIVDDVNLSFAEIRIRKSGGDGGHNGLSSIIEHLESDDFPRLRFGIGSDYNQGYLSDYVLSRFSNNEMVEIKKISDFSFLLLKSFISNGYEIMLSEYSRIRNLEINKNNSDDFKD